MKSSLQSQFFRYEIVHDGQRIIDLEHLTASAHGRVRLAAALTAGDRDYTLFLHRGGGDFLRRYREAKGWNRQQLADHAKVSRTSIRCWETGQKTISQKCFRLLAENLGPDFLSMLRM